MTYRITYTANTIPENLPEGYTVEKISALPVEIDRFAAESSVRYFHLDKSAHSDDVAFFAIDGVGKHLTREQTVQVRDALNELLNESAAEWDGHSAPPADVLSTRDKDGDHWARRGSRWVLDGGSVSRGWDDHDGPGRYAPHTDITDR